MVDGPFELLDCDEDLAEGSVDASLARVEAARLDYFVLMVQDVSISYS